MPPPPRAVGTAGSSVVFAGLTVVIALVGLTVVNIPMISIMGQTAAFAVVVAVLAAVTLLPAVLGLFGDKVFAGRISRLRQGDEPDTAPTLGKRWAQLVSAHPVVSIVAVVAALSAIALPAPKLELGMDLATGDQKKAISLLGDGFGEGLTAILSDLSDALTKAPVPYLVPVIGLAFLVLTVVFGSVLVPLSATPGFILSIGATFGATVAIFQQGWFGLVASPGPIISFLPIFLIRIVFGLAMDYQVFLVTRMREKFVMGQDGPAAAQAAVVAGFQRTARVVTSAALIMISVFAAFILSPDAVGKSMEFALAAAVIFDAFAVRMVFIPAVMALLGDRAWYLPRWLDRIRPDVEGRNMREATQDVRGSARHRRADGEVDQRRRHREHRPSHRDPCGRQQPLLVDVVQVGRTARGSATRTPPPSWP